MSCLYDNYIISIKQTSFAFFDTSLVHAIKYSRDVYKSFPSSKPTITSYLNFHGITKSLQNFKKKKLPKWAYKESIPGVHCPYR